MGDRYSWTEPCPACGAPLRVYYADSCGQTFTTCPTCYAVFDVEVHFKLVPRQATDDVGSSVCNDDEIEDVMQFIFSSLVPQEETDEKKGL